MNRILVAAALLLPLSGCWTGAPWFTASDAVNVIPDGRYRIEAKGEAVETGEIVGISRQPDGSLRLDGPEMPARAIVARLNQAAKDHRYIIQLEGPALGAGNALFLLLDNRDHRYRVSVLRCGGEIAEVVRRSGGSVSRDPQSATTCEFNDQKSLVGQLRLQAQEDGSFDIELKRITE
jgi:hypothetical protein